MKEYIYGFILLILTSACARIEEIHNDSKQLEKIDLHLTAMIDAESNVTKTYLDGEPVASVRNTYWLPEDQIAVASTNSVACFDNICTEKTDIAYFDGQVENSDLYYALYPYSAYPNPNVAKGHSFDDGILTVNIPENQKYEPNTFATDMVPMVAKFSLGEKLSFKNICGGLVFKLIGTDTIVSANFVAYDEFGAEMPLCGQFSVNMESAQYSMTPLGNVNPIISIDCHDGVKLSNSEPTAFHFVLPPAKYKGFKATFVSADGKYMVIQSDKTLNIRRSNITYVNTLTFEDNLQYIDLSFWGTSNCYIVSEAGAYSFDASVIGNGKYGIIDGAGFHTDNPKIAPVSVDVLWQDNEENIITSVKLLDNRVCFMATGLHGNALIAVKDKSGKILWSWHIWATDKPKEQRYINSAGEFSVLDRNIGAIRADAGTGDEWKESMGSIYLWGRKDPFFIGLCQKGRISMTIEESIQNPTFTHGAESWHYGVTSWADPANPNLWNESQKTIYDPCPIGYRVATNHIWNDFTTTNKTTFKIEEYNIEGGFKYGFDFYINPNKTETAWYPITNSLLNRGGYYEKDDTEGFCWASNFTENTDKYYFRLYYKSNMDTKVNLNEKSPDGYGYPVRCVKDENHVDVSLPELDIIAINDITPTSAKVMINVSSSGASKLTERGIIYGRRADLTDGVKVKSQVTETGDFDVNLSGLNPATVYYVKAYAVNEFGETHTGLKYFNTKYDSSSLVNAIDLSAYETSNCYIVGAAGLYVFNCSVKGNSSISIGNPVKAEVIWETKNTTEYVSSGEIISDVQLNGAYVSFMVPAKYTPGNALLAVKDQSGKILWSWHIWVTDFDPDRTAKKYISGATMMDRNLGALDEREGATAYGFLYQWGRKDPLIGSASGETSFAVTYPRNLKTYVSSSTGDSVTYSIQNPTVVIGNLVNDSSAWKSEKTMYDPCPPGWRVPDGGPEGVWRGIDWGGINGDNTTKGWIINEPYSVPASFYPAPGYTGGDRLELYFPRKALYCWSCTNIDVNQGYSMHLFDRIERELKSKKASEFSVRCMKEE